MGCDIHPYIEVKPSSSSRWLLYAEFWLPRDYMMFALLAGVRRESKGTEGIYLYEAKGLPPG